jgi:hypothetical protein
MKKFYSILFGLAAIGFSACGGGDAALDKAAKDMAALICKAKEAKGDEAKLKELQKELREISKVSQEKQMELAKAQKDKPEKEFMKEASEKIRAALETEAQKSCGVSFEEIKNFMSSGKLQKTDYGPHVAEVSGMTAVDLAEKDGFGKKIYSKMEDKSATIWSIGYHDNGNKTGGTHKDMFNYADVDPASLTIRKEAAGVIYTYDTYAVTLRGLNGGSHFVEELFNVNRSLEKKQTEYVFLTFKTEAEAQAFVDKVKAGMTAQ